MNENEDTLYIAIKNGDYYTVRTLLENGANVNDKTTKEITPLHIAAYYGHHKIAQLLIDKDAKLNEKDLSGNTPLHTATYFGHHKIAQLLIDKDAKLNEKDLSGNTPLHTATYFGHHETVKTLLKSGDVVNSKNTNGYLPIDIASHYEYPEIAKEIEQYHQNPIKYMLENNDLPEDTLNAIKLLEGQEQSKSIIALEYYFNKALDWINLPEYKLDYFSQVIECLEAQPAGFEIDLVSICGENGSFYTDTQDADNL